MNSSQQSLATISSSAYELGNDSSGRPVEDDIPLGCECANPALQIERWGQEVSSAVQEPY